MTIRRDNAIIGALVADASTMGLHWIYDQEQIAKIEQTGDILFRQPDANNYKNVKSYFAHKAKKLGEFSQYGESAYVVSQVIHEHGAYSVQAHQQLFFETFGPCGSYVGFADRPTKALVARLIIEADQLPAESGADDDQMPALCSVPALFASDASSSVLSQAVSVTNTHPLALDGAHVVLDCLARLSNGEALSDALAQSAANATPALQTLLQEALSKPNYQPLETAQHFGMACHMEQGLPVAWHLLKHAQDFESVVRDNIRCGGDSCGRAMIVGSIAGLAFGVPDSMKLHVTKLPLDGKPPAAGSIIRS